MFFPEQQVRVFLYGAPVDMRRSFDGLYAIARNGIKTDPLSGHLFAFINRRATQIKVLYFDRSGWCVWAKRLEADHFVWPRRPQAVIELTAEQLRWLLDGIDIEAVRRHPARPYRHAS